MSMPAAASRSSPSTIFVASPTSGRLVERRAVGQREAVAGDVRRELRQPLEGRDVAARAACARAPRSTRSPRRRRTPCRTARARPARGAASMKVDSSRTLAAAYGSAGSSGGSGKRASMYSTITCALAQRAVLGAEERHLAQRRGGEHRLVLAARADTLLGERHALLEQHHLDLVVVVRQREAAQRDHRSCLLVVCAKPRRARAAALTRKRQSPHDRAFLDKLCPRARLAARVAALPRPMVFTNGVFDILHRGHVVYLAQARALGAQPRDRPQQRRIGARARQGPRPPAEREPTAPACWPRSRASSLVTLFDEPTPVELLKLVRPELYVKGGDYDIESLDETRLVRSWGGDARTHCRSSTATRRLRWCGASALERGCRFTSQMPTVTAASATTSRSVSGSSSHQHARQQPGDRRQQRERRQLRRRVVAHQPEPQPGSWRSRRRRSGSRARWRPASTALAGHGSPATHAPTAEQHARHRELVQQRLLGRRRDSRVARMTSVVAAPEQRAGDTQRVAEPLRRRRRWLREAFGEGPATPPNAATRPSHRQRPTGARCAR